MRLETRLAQAGMRQDPGTGAVSMPIHHATTFAHPALGESTGFDYSRTQNPTRKALEDYFAELEGGVRGFAFASGMAAIHAVMGLFEPGQHLIVSDDLYGGTYRLFEQFLRPHGISVDYVNMSDSRQFERVVRPETRGIFIETPTNPTMKITDIAAWASQAKVRGILTIVDNTFMTPYLQQPLAFGADIVVHSATKYLGGHNDVLAGLVAVADAEVAERIGYIQNSIGSVLGPQDCWLLVRGMKTLALRMDRHNENALQLAEWLTMHSLVKRVYYPGLAHHVGREIHQKQAQGWGGMVSFELVDEQLVAPLLQSFRLVTFAESLGGVESLITYPARQTHFDMPQEARDAAGVTNELLRMSVGIEHIDDILADFSQAFERIQAGASQEARR